MLPYQQQDMFAFKSLTSADHTIVYSHRVLRHIARITSKGRHVSPKSAITGDTAYQSSFNSFWDMIHKEKQDAKKTVLVEDMCGCIARQTPQVISQLLDAPVEEIDRYMVGRRGFTLVKLRDHHDFVQRVEPAQSDVTFPLRSRMLILRKFPRSQTLKQAPIVNVTKTRSDATAILSDDNVEDAIDQFTSSARMSPLGSKIRFFFLNQLEEIICTGLFEQFHFLPFGSSVNGFGCDNSDLDISLDVRDNLVPRNKYINSNLAFHSKPIMSERFQSQRLVDFVGDHLQYFVPGIVNLQRIPRARVPIVKVHSEMTGLDCDISFQSARVSVKMAEILFEYSLLDERVRKLVHFIKIWAKQHILTNTSPGPWYTNFMLMLMVIHFFQTRSGFRLPSINELDAKRSVVAAANEDMTFLTILREFFEFISSFDFDNRGMSVLSGRSILKPSHSAIYIENPMEPDLNVTINVQSSEVRRLVRAANTSLAIMVDSQSFALSDLCKPTTQPTVTSFNTKGQKGVKVYEFLTE